jgi:hypothetical protein
MKTRKLNKRLVYPVVAELLRGDIYDGITVRFDSQKSGIIVASAYDTLGKSSSFFTDVKDSKNWRIVNQ